MKGDVTNIFVVKLKKEDIQIVTDLLTDIRSDYYMGRMIKQVVETKKGIRIEMMDQINLE